MNKELLIKLYAHNLIFQSNVIYNEKERTLIVADNQYFLPFALFISAREQLDIQLRRISLDYGINNDHLNILAVTYKDENSIKQMIEYLLELRNLLARAENRPEFMEDIIRCIDNFLQLANLDELIKITHNLFQKSKYAEREMYQYRDIRIILAVATMKEKKYITLAIKLPEGLSIKFSSTKYIQNKKHNNLSDVLKKLTALEY